MQKSVESEDTKSTKICFSPYRLIESDIAPIRTKGKKFYSNDMTLIKVNKNEALLPSINLNSCDKKCLKDLMVLLNKNLLQVIM